MAAFPFPQNSFLLDSSVLFQVPEFSEQPTNNISSSSCTPQFHDQSLTKKQSSDSSSSLSVVVDQNPPQFAKQFTQTRTSMDRSRKKRDGSPSTTTAQSMRITKKRSPKADHQKVKKPKAEKKVQKKKVPEEEEEVKFTGYVHVRARRGEATDSHSLAERARREKISERMKLLQSLVPGCDKITGKAFVLDEIISYVQSLQTQVEFLSMKLASVDPLCNDFGMGLEPLTAKPEALDSALPSQPTFQECNTFEAMPYGEDTKTSFNMASSCPNLDSPQSLLQFDHHHLMEMEMEMPNILHQDDFEQFLWDMDGQRQKQSHQDQYGFTANLCSFH